MRQSTKGADRKTAFSISKLPMRQSTEGSDDFVEAIISKLPMRQSTFPYLR